MYKNLAFIIPGLKNGGAERVLSTLSLNLNKNIKQYIFTWDGKEKDYDFNSEIIDFNIINSKNILINIFVLINRVIKARKYKKKYNIDTSISHLEGANIVNILSRRKDKIIITVHNFQTLERNGGYGFIFKILIRLLYNKADIIVAVSEEIKEDLIENFNIEKQKIKVIYNPFDVNQINDLSKEEIDNDEKYIFSSPVIINVGRLTKQKGQWHLIKIIEILKKDIPNIKLLILGKGELEKELKKMIVDLGLEDNVILMGFKNNPFKYIRNSDIFALTSLYEGFPMCLVEAMACETPVISVDCKSGPREILSDYESERNSNIKSYSFEEYGVLCKKFETDKQYENYLSEEVYAEAIKKLLEDEKRLKDYRKKGIIKAKSLDVKNIILLWESIIF